MSSFAVVLSRVLLASPAVPDDETAGGPPALDVAETHDSLVIAVDLPGVAPRDVRVTCADGRLEVAGVMAERVPSSTGPGAVLGFHRVERATGPFHRVVRLPGPVDAEHGTARVRDGVLTIVLPKVTA